MTRATRSRSRTVLASGVAGLLTFALAVPPGAQADPLVAGAPVQQDAAAVAAVQKAPEEADDPTDGAARPVAPDAEEAEFAPAEGDAARVQESSPTDDADEEAPEDADGEEPEDATPLVTPGTVEPQVATADATGFAVVGVTWSGDVAEDALVVEVRTSEDPDAPADADDGWDAWEEVSAEPSPDGTLDGTEPVVVGDVARVQARVTGSAPVRDLTLTVVDPGTSGADDDVPTPPQGTSPGGTAVAAAAVPDRPTISSRKAWGADESIMTWTPRQGSIRGAAIHHTAGTNSYSKSDVPRIIRGIYAYHAQTRDWGDIGYNFVVDKFGRVWEGRAGGITRQTIGGHARGYNTNSTGISVLGNYETTTVSSAAVTAVVEVAAWKLALHGVPATGSTTINGTREQRIFGHRDVASTACPGRTLYAKMGEIRRRADALQDRAAASQAPKVADGTFVENPNGNLAMVEKGRKHVAYCSVVEEFGESCHRATKVTREQWKALVPGGRLQRTVKTTDGRLYRIVNGKKREAFDMRSLERVNKKTKVVTLHANALRDLRYGSPIVRAGVVVVNRSNGNHRLVVKGRKHGYLGSALRERTPLKYVERGRLDGESVSRIPKVTKTTGVIKRSNGRQFLVTTRGLLWIDDTGRLRSSAKTQSWGTLPMEALPRIKGKPDVVVLKVRNKSQLYVLRDGMLRPVSKARARQINGGTTPRVHVILKLTKQQLPVGSRL
ncbi:N-acetylmuramoyl-L-alanine amidase [Isoptericola halotolerans]|uniref:N-acetylmuramoyl-L-alanine amidase n=1 Tax=Isoptericola halotolerans TaxID=300560 RepID=UPI003890F275